jgi:hypothetical protein
VSDPAHDGAQFNEQTVAVAVFNRGVDALHAKLKSEGVGMIEQVSYACMARQDRQATVPAGQPASQAYVGDWLVQFSCAVTAGADLCSPRPTRGNALSLSTNPKQHCFADTSATSGTVRALLDPNETYIFFDRCAVMKVGASVLFAPHSAMARTCIQ